MTTPNREFLLERDFQIFKLRKGGASVQDIAKRLGMNTAGVSAAIKRQITRLNKEALTGYPELVRMEIERIDDLMAQLWPMAHSRQVKLDDGTQMMVPPDVKATAEIRNLIAMRSKLLGLDQITIVHQTDIDPFKASLAGVEQPLEIAETSSQGESFKLIQIMIESGILKRDEIPEDVILKLNELNEAPVTEQLAPIEDGEIVG